MATDLLIHHRGERVGVYAPEPGGRWIQGRQLASASWPVAGPGGFLLITCVGRTPDGQQAHLETVDRAGERREVPGSGRVRFIAPRLPMYASWAPAGRRLAFVASEGDTIALSSWGIGSPDEAPVRLATGVPLFHAWRPDGEAVAVHAGNDLSVVSADGKVADVVSANASGFRVPAWSDDGQLLAWARLDGSAVHVMVRTGSADEVAARFEGGVALAFRPGSHDLTVAVARRPGDGAFDAVHVVSLGAEAQARRRLVRGPLTSFQWAPDGQRMALAVPAQTGDGRYSMTVVKLSGEILAASEALVPSVDTRLTLGFFDQYRLSQPWWSPGGEGLVICGRLVGDGVSGSFGDPEGSYAFWWPGRRGERLFIVAPGEMACFPVSRKPDVNEE